jgi:hypothetical protein
VSVDELAHAELVRSKQADQPQSLRPRAVQVA